MQFQTPFYFLFASDTYQSKRDTIGQYSKLYKFPEIQHHYCHISSMPHRHTSHLSPWTRPDSPPHSAGTRISVGVFGLPTGCAPEEELTVRLWFVRVERRAQAHRARPAAPAPAAPAPAAGLQPPGGSRPPSAALRRRWDMSCPRQVHHTTHADILLRAPTFSCLFPCNLEISLDAPVANWNSVYEACAGGAMLRLLHMIHPTLKSALTKELKYLGFIAIYTADVLIADHWGGWFMYLGLFAKASCKVSV